MTQNIREEDVRKALDENLEINMLKRMAKIMQKKFKEQGMEIKLSQCLDVVAAGVNKKDWHHLMHDAKMEIEKELRQKLSLMSFQLRASIPTDENSLWFLGKSGNDNLLVQDNKIRTHVKVVGKDERNQVVIRLAQQAIARGMGVTILDGAYAPDLVQPILETARTSGRKTSETSFAVAPHRTRTLDKFDWNIDDSPYVIEHILGRESENDPYRTQLITSMIALKTHYNRFGGTPWKFFDIPQIISWESVKKLSLSSDLPEETRRAFSFFLDAGKDRHENSIRPILDNVGRLRTSYSHLFIENGEITCSSLADPSSDAVIAVSFPNLSNSQPEMSYLGRLVSGMFKTGVVNFFTQGLDNSGVAGVIPTPKEKRKGRLLIMNGMPTPRGFAVIPAQARSMGISAVFSYESDEEMQRLSGTDEAMSTIANTNLWLDFKGEGRFRGTAGNESMDFAI